VGPFYFLFPPLKSQGAFMGNYLEEDNLKKALAEIEKIQEQYEWEAQRSAVVAVRGKIKCDQVRAEIDVAKADAISAAVITTKKILYKYWPREKV
jgi:hypothetical protein